MNRKALGRGLGALLSSDRTIDLGSEPAEVELESIVPGSMQPRTHFDEASLESLAESIRAHGIVQPLLVRRRGDGYELIAGERRWRAAQRAVWLRPQSGANDNFCGGAYCRHLRTRSATSAGVSI